MKQQLLLAILPLLLCCCKRSSDLPRLITTADSGIEVNTKEMLESKPTLLAFNFTEDTVVGYKTFTNIQKDFIYSKKKESIESDLKITIDTSHSFYAKNFTYQRIDVQKLRDSVNKFGTTKSWRDVEYAYSYKQKKMQSVYVSAYPLLIYNNSTDKAYIPRPSFQDLLLIQQALDADGKWKPIEFRLLSQMCSFLYSYYILSPKHYMATAIIKYKGDFKTKIRVKMIANGKVIYSNSVQGSINRSQFNQDFIKLYMQEWERSDEKIFQETKDIMFLDFLK